MELLFVLKVNPFMVLGSNDLNIIFFVNKFNAN